MNVLAATASALLFAANAASAANDFRVEGRVPDTVVHGESAEVLGQRLGQAALPVDDVAVPACAARVFAIKALSTVAANDPLLADVSKGRPIWHLRIEGKGCGPLRKHNIYLFDQGNVPIKLVPTLPGDTAANVKLQVDALQIVGPPADTMGPQDCPQRAVVIDTKIADAPHGKAPWSESWTFRKCAADIRFRLTFTPDTTGAGISARRE